MRKIYLKWPRLLFLLVLMTSVNLAVAQQRTITGTVLSLEDDSPIPGANVIIKGTSSGTVTNVDGTYSISVSNDDVLVFSFVGYNREEIAVSSISGDRYDISLAGDIQSLSEVVVVGYGEVRKRDATGAVASVKAKDFNQGVISSPEQLIQGKSAGVQITTNSGEPGSGVNIRIRGTSSVRGDNNPLFVVDGVPLAGNDISAGGADIGRGSSSARNPLNFLNPSDIESIDILKDASATAIYGSRGANGVVLITTKSGRGISKQFTYGSNVSFARPAARFDLLNRDEFLDGAEALGSSRSELDFGGDTNWQDEVYRTAISHRHDLAYGDSYGSGDYRASLSYDNQQGVVRNSSMERITARLNLNQDIVKDRLKLGAQVTLSRVNDEAPPITDNAGFEGDLLGATFMANPSWPADPNQQFDNNVANPNSFLAFSRDRTNTNRSLINLSLDYNIVENLKFTVNTGFDNSTSVRGQVNSAELRLSGGIEGNGRGFVGENDNDNRLLEAFFDYSKEYENSNLSVIAGYSYQQFNRSGLNVNGFGFGTTNMAQMVDDLSASSELLQGAIGDQPYQQFYNSSEGLFVNDLGNPDEPIAIANAPGVPVQTVTGDRFRERDELQSFFGRVNYNMFDKYLLTATVRADGSTRFGGNNKYGIFPSLAAAWRVSDEDFMPDLFDDFKIRAGYGVTGNQEIPHNLHQGRQRFGGIGITPSGDINTPGIADVAFANPDLRWEQTIQYNAGIDFAFVRGRLNGSFDVYYKNTTDLLIQVVSAQPAPNPFSWRNLDADVINRGVEFAINYIVVERDNTGLDFGFNIAYNHNEIQNFAGILETGAISGQGLTGAFAQRIQEGQPLNAWYLREFTGYDADGEAEYVGGVDNIDYLDKGSLPLVNLGFSANFRYKQWDITSFLTGQLGHYVYNNTANAFFTQGSLGNGRNVTRDVLGSPESQANAPEVSSRFLERADFLRLQNLNIGYQFANLNSNLVSSLRLFASGQNLFVLTDYTGLDPEVNTNKAIDGIPSFGIDYTAFPRPRTITIGLNATF